MEIDYAHIIGSSNHYPCFSVTWPTHYPGGQNIMDNSRQSAVLQDSVGKCCFFFPPVLSQDYLDHPSMEEKEDRR